jgi:hypothetical protein
LLVLAWARIVGAHWMTPDEVVAEVSSPQARTTLGVEAAVHDPQNARLLIVRVGSAWYALPRAKRVKQAGEWVDLWHRSVEKGLVAVLDARTDKPVVRFVRGAVAEVLDAPSK